ACLLQRVRDCDGIRTVGDDAPRSARSRRCGRTVLEPLPRVEPARDTRRDRCSRLACTTEPEAANDDGGGTIGESHIADKLRCAPRALTQQETRDAVVARSVVRAMQLERFDLDRQVDVAPALDERAARLERRVQQCWMDSVLS